jgi:hypothetical protein
VPHSYCAFSERSSSVPTPWGHKTSVNMYCVNASNSLSSRMLFHLPTLLQSKQAYALVQGESWTPFTATMLVASTTETFQQSSNSQVT